ncbi:uncharacterized protein LOC113777091 [Coffea eugenioides]|uniref:uncharacterized protein LOC113777091 n=1 Tax=Coffea eugenioides TaxID=49369 RepID=UPI000F604B4E|nr:uncharacterized protein LOC113777091 [Coffea eugenioides]
MDEISENYDCTIKYHPGKTNVVADTLSRQVQMAGLMIKELHLLEMVSYWNLRLESKKVILENILVNSTLLERIKGSQEKDTEVQKWSEKVEKGEKSDFNMGSNGILKFRNRIVVPNNEELKKEILEEAHRSKFTVHPGGNKMYQDLKSLPRTQRGHDAIWVIMDGLTKSAHFLPINMKYPLEKLATLYLDEIIRLLGIPLSIVSDKDPSGLGDKGSLGSKGNLELLKKEGKKARESKAGFAGPHASCGPHVADNDTGQRNTSQLPAHTMHHLIQE